MPSPKRRGKVYLGALTSRQELVLLHGGPEYGRDFPDERAARGAWDEHGDRLGEGLRAAALTPWAAWRFDGEPAGHSSPYCHLGDPRCNCRMAAR